MPRLLNALGLVLFAFGAVVVGYLLYLLIAGVLGWNPFGGQRPAAGNAIFLQTGLLALVLLAAGWLLGLAAVRAEWRQTMERA